MRNRINHFYKYYNIADANTIKLSRADMDDYDTLMATYESIYLTIEECGDTLTAKEYSWILALYNDLGDYISYGGDGKAVVIGNRAATAIGAFGILVFSICATTSLDWLTIGGLVLSVALTVVAGRGR